MYRQVIYHLTPSFGNVQLEIDSLWRFLLEMQFYYHLSTYSAIAKLGKLNDFETIFTMNEVIQVSTILTMNEVIQASAIFQSAMPVAI